MIETSRTIAMSGNADNGRDRAKPGRDRGRANLFAVGGIAGALLASSCCVIPLMLVTLGVSGAWIGNLTALEPFKPYFLAASALLLAAGFWRVYRSPRTACPKNGDCARPSSRRITKAILWLATILVVLAATVDYWAPIFY